jgi:hypothetical protein
LFCAFETGRFGGVDVEFAGGIPQPLFKAL